MNVIIRKNAYELAVEVADDICEYVRSKKAACICFAAGDTPKQVLERLVEQGKKHLVDFSQCTFVGLDEWVGLTYEDAGSCHKFLYDHFFLPLQIDEEHILFFDAASKDIDQEASRVLDKLRQLGGLDLALLGLGMNGHIGFNEPGTPFCKKAHVHDLNPITEEVGRKYFKGEMNCHQGITLGFHELL